MDSVAACERWLEQANIINSSAKSKNKILNKINEINILPSKSKVILMSGTNGKGTTSLLLENILQRAGYRIGSFISPHLCHLNERIRVDGKMVTDAIFCRNFVEVKAACEADEIPWFSFLFLVALHTFKSLPLDFLIIEVGIGGRFDVTNVLEPMLSIITTIGLDHMEILGSDREQIGEQKAGIFRASTPAICGDPQPPQSVLEQAAKLGTRLFVQARDFNYQQQSGQWSWRGFDKCFTHLPQPSIPLQNASTALAALTVLADRIEIKQEAIRAALKYTVAPGRYQVIAQKPRVVCDVAHNSQAVAHLATNLAAEPSSGKTFVVVAMKLNKAIKASLAEMFLPIDAWFLAELNDTVGFVPEAIAYLEAQRQKIYRATSVIAAFKKAKAMAMENDRIVVFGSFRTVQQVFSLFPLLANRIN